MCLCSLSHALCVCPPHTQLKSVLDIIAQDLFKNHMPSVTYMRMDGSLDSVQVCVCV